MHSKLSITFFLQLISNWAFGVISQSNLILRVQTRVSIVPGLFQFLVLGTFWTSLVPGPQDHRTFKVSMSCPVRSQGLGPFVPGVPGVLAGPNNFLYFWHVLHIFPIFLLLHNKSKKRRRENIWPSTAVSR